VTLHAVASDPNSYVLTYAWTQTAGQSAAPGGANTPDLFLIVPALTSQANGVLTFEVTVDNGHGGSASAATSVHAYMLGDISHDNHVDVGDLLIVAGNWGLRVGEPGFDPACDLNADGVLDVSDLLILAGNWGRTAP
jgi:hypothetical protein